MRAAVIKEHRNFFRERGWIKFESIFSEKQIEFLNQEIDKVIAARLLINPDRLRQHSSESLFIQGHDIWRGSQQLRKLLSHPNLTDTVSELVEKNVLRLGYDQLIPAKAVNSFDATENKGIYTCFLQNQEPLQTLSSLEGILCAVVVALTDQQENEEELEETIEKALLPKKKGETLFISPTCPLDWSQLYQRPKQRFYLIVYSSNTTIYRLEPKDPHTHYLKHLGHIFNNPLTDKLNPIVHR